MAQDYTTTAMLASLKRRGMLPSITSGQAWATADYLAAATEECQTYIMALLMDANEEYGVADYDQTLVSGTASYFVPPRASGERLRDVQLLMGTDYVSLSRVDSRNISEYQSSSGSMVYYVEDQRIVLVPTPSTTGTLRMKYYRQPGKLVETSAVATISSIDAGRTVITTTATIPSTFTSGVSLDVVDVNPGFRCLTIDAATTGTVSGTTITLSSALPSTVAAGDYVCLAGETPVAQIPVVCHPLLIERTRWTVLEALGDKRADRVSKKCQEMRADCLKLLTPKVKTAVKYVINRNGPGFSRVRFHRS